mmetsp:Transcript_15479/g.32733  ORF Transcript_15479/g.32733 Transcript_15479/m.32733 type:complete len:98 (+) Transcript_15479:571-864(+)
MKYVAGTERTYKPSTGLTSPQVLKEYLSDPEEIIGIEHLLRGQKKARENLKAQAMKALEQIKHDKKDWQLLADTLKRTSSISANMAHDRAKYITLLE